LTEESLRKTAKRTLTTFKKGLRREHWNLPCLLRLTWPYSKKTACVRIFHDLQRNFQKGKSPSQVQMHLCLLKTGSGLSVKNRKKKSNL